MGQHERQHCAAHHKSPNSHSSVVRFQNLPKPHFFPHLIFKDRVKLAVAVEEQRWAVPPRGPPDAQRGHNQCFLFTYLIIYLIIYLRHPRRVIPQNVLVFWWVPPWLMVTIVCGVTGDPEGNISIYLFRITTVTSTFIPELRYDERQRSPSVSVFMNPLPVTPDALNLILRKTFRLSGDSNMRPSARSVSQQL